LRHFEKEQNKRPNPWWWRSSWSRWNASGQYKSAAKKVRSTMVLNDPSYRALRTTNR